MTPAERYRARAAALDAQAKLDTNPKVKAELAALAANYRLLSEQADQSASLPSCTSLNR